MKACFIGSHFGLPDNLILTLKEALKNLIAIGCDCFYCGTYGEFDKQVYKTLKELKKDYRCITIVKVKPYYQNNIFSNKKEQYYYMAQKQTLKYEYSEDNKIYNEKLRLLRNNVIYASWYQTELD